MITLPIPPGRYAVTRRRSPAPGCEGDRVYAEAQPVTLHALVSDGQRVMALVEHEDGHFETVREVDLQRLAEHEGILSLDCADSARLALRKILKLVVVREEAGCTHVRDSLTDRDIVEICMVAKSGLATREAE